MCDVTLISFINNYTATGINLGDRPLTVNGSNFIDLSTKSLAFYQRYIASFVANNNADSEMLSATISKYMTAHDHALKRPMWQSLCYSILYYVSQHGLTVNPQNFIHDNYFCVLIVHHFLFSSLVQKVWCITVPLFFVYFHVIFPPYPRKLKIVDLWYICS